jgi:hypothetical protein
LQFLLDGVNLGPEMTAAPYEAICNTLGIVNGQHTLSAIARDAAGHHATHPSVVVTVANEAPAPEAPAPEEPPAP